MLLQELRGDPKGFEEDLILLNDWYPHSVELQEALAAFYQDRGNWAETLAVWERVLGAHPASVKAQAGRGMALEQLGRLQEALLAYQRALDQDPRNPERYENLFRLYRRLNREHERLVEKYHVEAGLDADDRMVFQLMPREGYGKLTFYLACGPGFPDDGPTAFLMVGGKPHPLFSPSLTIWSAEHRLVEVADDMVEWLTWSLDDYLAAAEEALDQGAYRVAADWLTIVLSINPRAPRAARLLAQAQAPLG